MVRAVERAYEIGAVGLQIFVDNPTAWKRRSQPPAELPAFRARLAALGMGPLAVHGPYLINLASPDPAIWERSVETLAGELRMGAAYGAACVCIHVGSHRGSGAAAGTAAIARGLARALERAGEDGRPRLVLENSAGGGDGLGATLEELEAILEACQLTGLDPSRIAFCLDTAHLWGAGHDIATPEGVDRLAREFDARLGPERLAMVHLNDSKAPLGSRVDRHQHLGAGGIGPRGLHAVLTHPRLAAVPAYLETPGMDEGYDAINVDRKSVV